jgi:DNA-binding transcriptional regulator YiaG
MSNVMKELKSEITRLARKEVKGELATPRKSIVAQRGLIADLRRQVNAMQKELNALKKAVPEKVVLAKEPQGRFWMTGQGVKALRKRLGLTQASLAKLAGVTSNAVVLWEGKSGKINMRKATGARLQELKGKGKREVAEILAKEPKAKAKAKAKRKS